MLSPARRFRNTIYAQFARVPKALASAPRLEILQVLSQAPRTVEALARLVEMSLANTSQHLQVLRNAGLVEAEKQGLFVTYRVVDPAVTGLLLLMRNVAEARLGDVAKVTREFLSESGQDEPVDEVELLRKIKEGAVTLIDVRPPEEFAAGHLPGSISVPLPELAARLASLPRRRMIVAVCRGRYCVLGIEAVRLLRAAGLKAVRLPKAISELAAEGLAMAQGGVAP
ncbi:ArsR/SmtB family transcription factor [Anaeromyxobacter paludicola]|uniref:ArsR family transcriptional regulator n=1 Tax=Anaeromyxobacter paludicola TaxID=2918171 RepID=A0ABN6N733_9BACT|nr:metalloregulator ArsR/SmtB family transcription factor [Anaeromyxobacter paludicola]BDG08851.1 ArsR family transcriptional regulator [Anaeromyxobacter paludicola]